MKTNKAINVLNSFPKKLAKAILRSRDPQTDGYKGNMMLSGKKLDGHLRKIDKQYFPDQCKHRGKQRVSTYMFIANKWGKKFADLHLSLYAIE